jgi:hypothetical protein
MHAFQRAAVAAALASLIAGAAIAQEKGVRINGAVRNTTVANGSVNIAKGVGTTARTTIGSITDGARINGNLDMSVVANGVVTSAGGVGTEAITSIGSVHEGAEVSGSRSVIVHTGQVINSADGIGLSGEPSCVVIGSIGEVPGC